MRVTLLAVDRQSNSSFSRYYIVEVLSASSAWFGFCVCWTS